MKEKDIPNFKILDERDPVLHKVSEPITFPIDDKLKKTINDCLDYLEMSQNDEIAEKYDIRQGMGLSLCQIGILKRCFVVSEDYGDGTFGRYIVINPELISHSEERIYVGEGEGCLSINRPTEGIVPRYARIRVKAYDLDGNEFEARVREDIAVAFQHEMDHLDGILFTDKIDPKNPYKDKEIMREI